MKYYLILIFVFLSCSFINQDKYSIERYRIYDTILDLEIPWSQYRWVLVSTESARWNPVLANKRDSLLTRYNNLQNLKYYWQDFNPGTFLPDYDDRNSVANPIDVNLLHPYGRVDSINLKTSTQSDYFREDNIDNAIVYCFSMPSFNKEFTEAILYYQYYCGNSRGAGAWCWLRKKGNVWGIIGKHQVWWS